MLFSRVFHLERYGQIGRWDNWDNWDDFQESDRAAKKKLLYQLSTEELKEMQVVGRFVQDLAEWTTCCYTGISDGSMLSSQLPLQCHVRYASDSSQGPNFERFL